MSARTFELNRRDPIGPQIQRLLSAQLDTAEKAASARSGSPKDHAHEIRRKLKKARAVLRLVRGEIGEKTFYRTNRRYRDIARVFALVRDADVLLQTFDNLPLSPRARERLRAPLEELTASLTRSVLKDKKKITAAIAALHESQRRVGEVKCTHRGWKAMAEGLESVYAKGRRQLQRTHQRPTDKAFHEWRKSAKYLRYQLELLQGAWPGMLKEVAGQLHQLTDYLGEDHDLVTLRQTLEEQIDFDDREAAAPLFTLIQKKQKRLRSAAQALGALLYGEKPQAFVARLQHYWQVAGADSGQRKRVIAN